MHTYVSVCNDMLMKMPRARNKDSVCVSARFSPGLVGCNMNLRSCHRPDVRVEANGWCYCTWRFMGSL